MDDEEYAEAIGPLIEKSATWAANRYSAWSGVIDRDDLIGDLWVAALKKKTKLAPRLEAGDIGYVVTALHRAAHDALEPDWKHQKHSGGTVDDLETGHLEASFYDAKGRMIASKNPRPTPCKIQRIAATAAERALERKQQERAAAVVMASLDAVDAEILRVHLGNWLGTEANAKAIALELGMAEKTVYRRLAAIKNRLRDARENAEPLSIAEGF